MDNIDIKGLDKAEVLAALFNASKQQGMGFMDKSGANPISVEDARSIIDAGHMNFDYLRGRVMKVSIDEDTLDPRLYDRDNGQGAASRALEKLRTPVA